MISDEVYQDRFYYNKTNRLQTVLTRRHLGRLKF